ncbi:hypothetical protein [Nostoc sp.]|uniref:hypothetical protein n=1 Tax=Nostoc sp. TaxID=1180 RepID=UPI002FFB4611
MQHLAVAPLGMTFLTSQTSSKVLSKFIFRYILRILPHTYLVAIIEEQLITLFTYAQ